MGDTKNQNGSGAANKFFDAVGWTGKDGAFTAAMDAFSAGSSAF